MSAVVALALPELAEQINAEHAAAENHAGQAVEHALRAGALLLQAKKAAGHGAWLGWLQKNVTVTPRMAQNYMSLARALPKLAPENAKRVSHLSVRDAVRTIATGATRIARLPDRDREEVCKAVEAGEHSFAAVARQREHLTREILRRRHPNPIRSVTGVWDHWSTAANLIESQARRVAEPPAALTLKGLHQHVDRSLLPFLPEHFEGNLVPRDVFDQMRARRKAMRKELSGRVKDLVDWALGQRILLAALLEVAANRAPDGPILVARRTTYSDGCDATQLDLRNLGVPCEKVPHAAKGCRCNDEPPLGCPKPAPPPSGRSCLECDRRLTFSSYSGYGDLCDACAARAGPIAEAVSA
jgi:hypothetical protein